MRAVRAPRTLAAAALGHTSSTSSCRPVAASLHGLQKLLLLPILLMKQLQHFRDVIVPMATRAAASLAARSPAASPHGMLRRVVAAQKGGRSRHAEESAGCAALTALPAMPSRLRRPLGRPRERRGGETAAAAMAGSRAATMRQVATRSGRRRRRGVATTAARSPAAADVAADAAAAAAEAGDRRSLRAEWADPRTAGHRPGGRRWLPRPSTAYPTDRPPKKM